MVGRTQLCTTVALLAAFAAAQASAEETPKPREWRLSVAVGPAFALGRAAERWAKLAGERSGGSLAIVLRPGASLSQRDPDREFGTLVEGGAELAVGSTLHWSARVNELAVVGLPWIAPERRALAALAGGDVRDRLAAAIERAGAVPLAFAPLGHRAIATREKAIHTPGDVRGLRVRITSTRFLTDFYAELGLAPQSMPLVQAADAFRSATLDAQEGPLAGLASTRLDTLGVAHATLWGAVGEIAVFAVNRAAWEAWSDGQRAAVAEAAREAADALAHDAVAEQDAALTTLKARGAELLALTPTGRAAFAAAARPTYDKWAAIAGEDLVRAAEAAVRAATP
jgi:TRAP-type C4-dicarboxylate transport system substrate-binding protein